RPRCYRGRACRERSESVRGDAGALLEPLPTLLAAFALLLHAFALPLHPLAAPFLAIRRAVESVRGLDVALRAKLLGPLVLGFGLLHEVLAALLAPFALLLAPLALAVEPLGAALHPIRAIGPRHRGNEHESAHHYTQDRLHPCPPGLPDQPTDHGAGKRINRRRGWVRGADVASPPPLEATRAHARARRD